MAQKDLSGCLWENSGKDFVLLRRYGTYVTSTTLFLLPWDVDMMAGTAVTILGPGGKLRED